jgi:tRNA1Val (adenine37-N6)-methyltransferase
MTKEEVFTCKEFKVLQSKSVMKVNSDGMLLGAWSDVSEATRILDIGTGTGIIALMLAQRTKNAIIDGIEIDVDSAEEARVNFKTSMWRERLNSIHGSIQEYSSASERKYDLIVSNPPFFSGGTFSENENKNNVRHTIKLSHGDLLIGVTRLLTQKGRFDLVLPYMEGERLIDLAQRYNLFPVRVTEMRPKVEKSIERLLISLAKEKIMVNREELIMYKETDVYTEDYKNLTKDFYLKF